MDCANSGPLQPPFFCSAQNTSRPPTLRDRRDEGAPDRSLNLLLLLVLLHLLVLLAQGEAVLAVRARDLLGVFCCGMKNPIRSLRHSNLFVVAQEIIICTGRAKFFRRAALVAKRPQILQRRLRYRCSSPLCTTANHMHCTLWGRGEHDWMPRVELQHLGVSVFKKRMSCQERDLPCDDSLDVLPAAAEGTCATRWHLRSGEHCALVASPRCRPPPRHPNTDAAVGSPFLPFKV